MKSTRCATRTTTGSRPRTSSAAIRTTSCSRSPYFVWAIVGPHGHFVVDTGFDAAMAQKRGRTLLKPVDEGLKAIGLDAGAVEDIIVTHMHYDHTGNHDLFPRARYHLQDDEMAYATGRYLCHGHIRVPFEADDVVALVRKVFADRVVFHDGTDEIAPGITVHRIGGHSKGLQCVRVKTRARHVVLASDASHLYAHIDEGACSRSRFASATCSRATRRSRSSRIHRITSCRDTILRSLSCTPPRHPASRAGSCVSGCRAEDTATLG